MTNEENSKSDAAEEPAQSLESELEKAKKDYLYLLAEFDNYRKNAIKERSDLVKYGSERLVREFLGILDNFERALQTEANEGNASTLRQGVQMIASEIKTMLNKFGVEEIKAEGQEFNPTQHEALGSEPREDMAPGKVARVYKKAYKMHDKLIRPAQVMVSATPEVKN